ncbi:hypothetical protein [Priestia endophytica]|uniref:hypothetical protein n=1 Tax=Priestia endophytica TaxID=135735 RepID=UPI0022820EAA|nr:hypothetical protein [Priestia endophytica]MCY8235558.1 hypothetical protein [Priestia endophytica]
MGGCHPFLRLGSWKQRRQAARKRAAVVTKEKVLELAEKATITGSVGGNPDSLPKQWTDWLKHL